MRKEEFVKTNPYNTEYCLWITIIGRSHWFDAKIEFHTQANSVHGEGLYFP